MRKGLYKTAVDDMDYSGPVQQTLGLYEQDGRKDNPELNSGIWQCSDEI